MWGSDCENSADVELMSFASWCNSKTHKDHMQRGNLCYTFRWLLSLTDVSFMCLTFRREQYVDRWRRVRMQLPKVKKNISLCKKKQTIWHQSSWINCNEIIDVPARSNAPNGRFIYVRVVPFKILVPVKVVRYEIFNLKSHFTKY